LVEVPPALDGLPTVSSSDCRLI